MYDSLFTTKSQIDFNDTLFARERISADVQILEQIPAPVTKYESGIYKGQDKINPHVSRFVLSDGKQLDVFHIKPVYYLHQNGGWRPMSEIASKFGNKNIELREDWADNADYGFISWLIKRADLLNGKILIPSPLKYIPVSMYARDNYATLHFSTLTVYPDPNAETTTVDGWVGRGDLGAGREDWSTIRSGTGIEHGDSDATADAILINNYGLETNFKENRRGITLFDTSALTSGATISSAILSVKPSAISDHHGATQALGVVAVVPASNTALADTDYNIANWTMTRQASDIDFGSLSAGVYADYTLNGTGLGNVSKTGITKFGWACSGDIDNSSPGNDSAFVTSVTFNFADQTGTTSDPKLVVTYTSNVDVTVSATVLSATFSLPASTVTAIRNVSVSSTVLSATFSTPARTVTTSVSIARAVLSATFSIPSYNVVIADAVITPSPFVLNFSIPAFAITTTRSIDVTPSALSATFAVPSFTPTGTSGVTVSIGTVLSALFSTPAPTITTTRTVIISSEILQMIFTIPTFTSRGDFWQEKFSAPATSWSDKISQPSTNWSNKY